MNVIQVPITKMCGRCGKIVDTVRGSLYDDCDACEALPAEDLFRAFTPSLKSLQRYNNVLEYLIGTLETPSERAFVLKALWMYREHVFGPPSRKTTRARAKFKPYGHVTYLMYLEGFWPHSVSGQTISNLAVDLHCCFTDMFRNFLD